MSDENLLGGFINDPDDERDTVFSMSARSGDIDLIELGEDRVLPVSRQRWSSSCVANATADMLELDAAVDGLTPEEISRLQIYWNGRAIMYAELIDSGRIEETEMQDAGMFIRCAMKAISKCGVCPEEMWPFDLSKIQDRPKLKAMFRGLKNRIDDYSKITSTGLDQLEDFHNCFRMKQPIVFGIPITREFMDKSGPEIIDPPADGEEILGYHAIGGVGCKGELTKIRNSWGDWRRDGYAYLTPEWFAENRTIDCWTFTRGRALKK